MCYKIIGVGNMQIKSFCHFEIILDTGPHCCCCFDCERSSDRPDNWSHGFNLVTYCNDNLGM